MREQIVSVLGSCGDNILAYEAHSLKKQNRKCQAQTIIVYNFFVYGTF